MLKHIKNKFYECECLQQITFLPEGYYKIARISSGGVVKKSLL